MYTPTGRILTSVSVEAASEAASLCIETGAIAEAHRLNEAITASVCLVREDGMLRLLPSGGTCMERSVVVVLCLTTCGGAGNSIVFRAWVGHDAVHGRR